MGGAGGTVGMGGREKSGHSSLSSSAFPAAPSPLWFLTGPPCFQLPSRGPRLGSGHTAPVQVEGLFGDSNPWAALQEILSSVCPVCSNLYLPHNLSLETDFTYPQAALIISEQVTPG